MEQVKTIIALLLVMSPFAANATLLTFDSDQTPVYIVSDDYGDRVTSEDDLLNGFQYLEGNGFTPNVVVEYAPSAGSFSVWNGYGSLTNALGHNSFDVPGSILLIADAGWLVALNSFDVSAWSCCAAEPSSVRVYDGSDNVLFDTGTFTPSNSQDFNYTFAPSYVAQTLRIELFDFGDLALDNVNFDQISSSSSVPEPGTLALLGLGLAGMGVMRRKRI